MCQSEVAPEAGLGLDNPDPLVREAHLMAHDYVDYVVAGGRGGSAGRPPSPCSAALRHAGDELLLRFPIFFRRWPRVFKDVDESTACPLLMSMLDEHFSPAAPGGRRRELAWSAVLSVYVLAGQMALHCTERGMRGVIPHLKASVGAYVERVICPKIRDKDGWNGFVSRFGRKPDLESRVKTGCSWTLLLLATSLLCYFLWKHCHLLTTG